MRRFLRAALLAAALPLSVRAADVPLSAVVEAVQALPPESGMRLRLQAVLDRGLPADPAAVPEAGPAAVAQLAAAASARARDLEAAAARGDLSGAELERAESELRPFAALDPEIARAAAALARRAGEERAIKAEATARALESALRDDRAALVPSLSAVEHEHFRARWTAPSAPLPSPAERARAAEEREREARRAAAAGLSVAPAPGADHAPAPTLFDTKTGAVALPHLYEFVPRSPSLRRWARADPGQAALLGVREEPPAGELRAPLPRALMARVDYLRSIGDALAPALRVSAVTDAARAPWREQLRALAAGGFVVAAPRGAPALEDAQVLAFGALTLPASYIARLRRRAAELDGALARGDRSAAGRARALVRRFEESARAVAESRLDALPARAREELSRRRARAAAVMEERRRWPETRGWSFRQEIGLREFFRLHAPEIRATFESRADWLSESRRRIMRWLGFDFSRGLQVPSYREYDVNYLRAADALGIAQSDRLRFVLCYEDAAGRLVHTHPGEPAPAGATPITRPLTTREILDLMAQGMFPLAHNEFLDQTGDVFYIHDAVSHGVSFLDKPAYARAIIEAARVLVRRDGGLMGLGNSVNRNGPLSDRLFYILEEFMDFRRRPAPAELARLAELPDELAASDPATLRYADILAALERLPAEDVAARARRLVDRMPSLLESVGGNAADDLFTRRDKLDDLKKPVVNKMYFSKTWKMVRQALEDPAANPEPLARATARLQVYLLRLGTADPWRLLLHAARPLQDETSDFWRLMRGSGLLDPSDPAELKLLRNLGLADDFSTRAETSEVEAKFLLPDLRRIRADVLRSLASGAADPRILRRGFVVQEYLEVTPENLRETIGLLTDAGIPFGERVEQHALLEPGNAKEIRLMTKSIRVHEPGDSLELESRREVLQLAIKAVGGLSVSQLETPETLTAEQARRLREIAERLRPRAKAAVRKAYFELIAYGPDGRPLLRPDGKPYSVEVDLFLGRDAGGAPEFVNGEIEFHGADRGEAEALARALLEEPEKLPEYLADDLSDEPAAKTREIAARGVPSAIAAKLRPHAEGNRRILRAILKDFSRWADPEVRRLAGL